MLNISNVVGRDKLYVIKNVRDKIIFQRKFLLRDKRS